MFLSLFVSYLLQIYLSSAAPIQEIEKDELYSYFCKFSFYRFCAKISFIEYSNVEFKQFCVKIMIYWLLLAVNVIQLLWNILLLKE